MHLTAKFHYPKFSHSEVIVRTNTQTDTAEKIHLAPLCYINKTHEQVKAFAYNRHYNYTENYRKQNNTQEKHSNQNVKCNFL